MELVVLDYIENKLLSFQINWPLVRIGEEILNCLGSGDHVTPFNSSFITEGLWPHVVLL